MDDKWSEYRQFMKNVRIVFLVESNVMRPGDKFLYCFDGCPYNVLAFLDEWTTLNIDPWTCYVNMKKV